jgi:hypothetical protein
MSVVRDFPEEKVVSDVEDLEIREVENGGWEIFGEVVVAEMKKIKERRIRLRAKVEEKSLKWHVTRTWPVDRWT